MVRLLDPSLLVSLPQSQAFLFPLPGNQFSLPTLVLNPKHYHVLCVFLSPVRLCDIIILTEKKLKPLKRILLIPISYSYRKLNIFSLHMPILSLATSFHFTLFLAISTSIYAIYSKTNLYNHFLSAIMILKGFLLLLHFYLIIIYIIPLQLQPKNHLISFHIQKLPSAQMSHNASRKIFIIFKCNIISAPLLKNNLYIYLFYLKLPSLQIWTCKVALMWSLLNQPIHSKDTPRAVSPLENGTHDALIHNNTVS